MQVLILMNLHLKSVWRKYYFNEGNERFKTFVSQMRLF